MRTQICGKFVDINYLESIELILRVSMKGLIIYWTKPIIVANDEL